MQLHSTQYSVLTQRLRTGSKSGTAAQHWGKQEGIHSVCHCLSDDIPPSTSPIFNVLPHQVIYSYNLQITKNLTLYRLSASCHGTL